MAGGSARSGSLAPSRPLAAVVKKRNTSHGASKKTYIHKQHKGNATHSSKMMAPTCSRRRRDPVQSGAWRVMRNRRACPRSSCHMRARILGAFLFLALSAAPDSARRRRRRVCPTATVVLLVGLCILYARRRACSCYAAAAAATVSTNGVV